MSIQVYSSGKLAFDSRLPEEKQYSMLSIHIKEGLNKGGTATLVLPPMHPHINGFPAYAVPVEIYRNGVLRWRGRPLPSTGDIYGRRTITCEGELCFLQDVTHRPYAYKGKPEDIFHQLLAVYNAAVEPWKRFAVGIVSVTSESDIDLASKEPEQVFAAVSKLRQMCGGYILFDTATDGSRRINWFKVLPYVCGQKIQLGYNLMDYSNQTDTTSFATRIIPYGEFDDNDVRITIDIDGKDYVEDAEAVALYGIVEKPVIYDGVTDPAELEALAKADLIAATSFPETISLSAVDMSRIDASIDSFSIGQTVAAESKPHNLTGRYDLVELEEDLINPTVGSVTVTKDAATYTKGAGTLTGALQQQIQAIQSKPSQSAMDRAVAAATAWLTNGQGYKVERRDAAGNTIDTLYMDTPDINTAVNVLRIGQSGIGFSHNGINGPYVSAWTIDGKFNADFITTGILTANLIKTGVLTSTDGTIAIDLTNNTFSVNTESKLGSLVYHGKIEFSRSGLKLYGWDLSNDVYVHGLSLLSGHSGEKDGMRGGDCSCLRSSSQSIAIIAGSGKEVTIGSKENDVNVRGDNIKIDARSSLELLGKIISLQYNGDGTYTLIGTDPT